MSFSLWTFTSYGLKTLWQAVRGKRFRNGYACVNFGEPVSLRQWMNDQATSIGELRDVQPLAEDLMRRIGNITPILPVALVTTLFANNPSKQFSVIELKAAVLDMLDYLESQGHRAYIPRGDYNYAVDVGVRMLTLRNILVEEAGMLSAKPGEHAIIKYYSNSIAHLLKSEQAGQSNSAVVREYS